MQSVVFLTVDCLRADHVGCYGYDRPTTPNIDSVARDATRYTNAYANCPGTRWAFQSLHTGLWTSQIEGLGIPEHYTGVLAAQFANAGYATAGFTKNGFVSRDYGYDTGFDTFCDIHSLQRNEHIIRRIGRTIDTKLDNQTIRDVLFRPARNVFQRVRHQQTDDGFTPDIPDETITDEAIDWINSRQNADEPYFAWLHFMNAHTPYGRWPTHLQAIRGDQNIDHTIHPGDEGRIEVGQRPPQQVIDTYDAGIRSVDQQIGRLIETIDTDTVVVITGDHGEEFGRHRPFHTESFCTNFVHVPLIVRASDIDAGVRAEPVQHLDIPPTMAEAAGISPPDAWQGDPLQTIDRSQDDPIFFDLDHGRRAVHRGEWKLIREQDSLELYNIEHGDSKHESDPVTDEHETRLQTLLEILADHENAISQMQHDGRTDEYTSQSSDDEISDTVQENLKNLGYVE